MSGTNGKFYRRLKDGGAFWMDWGGGEPCEPGKRIAFSRILDQVRSPLRCLTSM